MDSYLSPLNSPVASGLWGYTWDSKAGNKCEMVSRSSGASHGHHREVGVPARVPRREALSAQVVRGLALSGFSLQTVCPV